MKRPDNDFVWYALDWQRPFTIDDVTCLLAHISSSTPRGYLAFEVRSRNGEIMHYVGFSPQYSGKMIELFRSHGEIELTEVKNLTRKPVSLAKHLTVSKPILSLNADVTDSAVRSTLAAMSATRTGEEAVVQVILGRGFSPSPAPYKMQDPHESWLDLALFGIRQATPESVKSAKEKAGQFMFQTIIRVGASGKNAEGRVDNILSAFRVLQSAGVNLRAFDEEPLHLDNVYIPWQINLRLSVRELAPFLLLPAGEEDLPGVPGIHPKRMLPPRWYKEPLSAAQDRSFAYSMNNTPKKLSISPHDALEHTIILGPTGSGKSTAMEHLILSDITAGRSVLVLDPKADLVTEILERIPEERKEDVVVIDPSDPCPVGFNPLRFKGFRNKALVADAVLSVMKEIFSDSWGIRTQQILSAALLTLADIPDASLLWLPALLTDADFRQRITSRVKDRIGLLPFWQQYEQLKDSERNQNIAPVLNKMQQFVFRPGLRAVLGQSKPKFDLMELFFERKIVLVPLNRGIIGGESARLLGSLIVGLTWTLALSRASIPAEKRHLVSIYIDELQDYLSLPTDLADALAQARGLGVGMTLAHQYRGQLPPEIKAGVDANARNKIIFGLNGVDAKEMAGQAMELSQEDFMMLPRYQIYTNIMQDRKSTGWIQGMTFPPSQPIRMAAELKAESMKRYGRPSEEVEAEFLKLMEPVMEDEMHEAEDDSPTPRPRGHGPVNRGEAK